ncbi:MAG TPA: plastocyanin/azurin family copper-binding protein [Solirubrobacteraceae bacterium]|nr:plastocyanin/azurin family copper-binding protein [Solirubrobacteraceae bacterium]
MLSRPGLQAAFAGLAAAAAALALSACSAQNEADDANLIAGKQLFVQKCGSCHVLARAGTKGTTGPDLDEAFQRAIKDGMPRSDFAGAIHGQILHPSLDGVMPAKLVTGDEAYDIAAYVAKSVAAGGKDTGLLATAVKQAGGGKPAVESNGSLQIDADPTGQLAFVTNTAQGAAGKITVKMANKSGTPHDIVIDGKGKGEVVQSGGVSQFSADFPAGSYTFYCSVPGHRQAGMQGKLTVK